jgi:hypothetical protein
MVRQLRFSVVAFVVLGSFLFIPPKPVLAAGIVSPQSGSWSATSTWVVLDLTGATSIGGVTGDVLGDVKRTDIGSTERAFGNPGTSVLLNSGSASSIVVTTIKPMPSAANFANAVNRMYSISLRRVGKQ